MSNLHPTMAAFLAPFVPSIERADSGPAWMDRASEESDREACRRAVAQGEMEEDFRQACKKGDANALCDWAPMTTDWDAVKRMPIDQKAATTLPKRMQVLHEVLTEALDFQKGPTRSELMQLLLNTANGSAAAQQQARQLLTRMGAEFASIYGGEQ
jgi:hypothetical protein